MNRLKYFALAALVAFAACDEGDEVVVPEPITGAITGTVTVDGAGAAGVTVTLSSGASATTASNGSFTFSDVEAGAYTVSISGTPSDAAFGTTSQAAVISSAGQVVTLSFEGSFITTSAISASISVPGVGALSGATISISGQSSASQTTGASGTVTFSGLRAGSYTVSVALSAGDAALYDLASASEAVTLAVDELQAVAFTATPKTVSSISGTLFLDEAAKNNSFDSTEDALSVANIAIIIEGVSVGVFDTVQTAADGTYSLTGLPAANYRVALQTGDAQIPGAVAFSADSDAAPVITLGVADSEVIDFPFDIITQQVQVGAFLGLDANNAEDTPLVEGTTGVRVSLYDTQANAAAGGTTGRLALGFTSPTTGRTTLSFTRANDTQPSSSAPDNIVFARVVPADLPAAPFIADPAAEDIIEIPFEDTDSLKVADDVFDFLSNQVTVGIQVQEVDGDQYAGLATRASLSTAGPQFATSFTDASGMAYFTLTGGVDDYFVQFSPVNQPNLPLTAGITLWPEPFTIEFDEAAGDETNGWLEFEYDGTSLPTDTIFLGTANIRWDEVNIEGRLHREINDEGDIPTFQPADESNFTDAGDIELQQDVSGTWTMVGGTVNPNAANGRFVFDDLATGESYRLYGSTATPVRAILNDTIVAVDGTDGGDQIVSVCPLRDGTGTTFATCSTFAIKNQNGTITGNVLYRDGTPAAGVDVRISPADSTIQGMASRAAMDTVVTTNGAGEFTTNATVREGFYDVTPLDDAPDFVFFASTNGGTDVVDIEDNNDVQDVARIDTNGTDGLALSGDEASFHAFRNDASITGYVVNDRDQDGNTIDVNEALIGATITLYADDTGTFGQSADSIIGTATIAADGTYEFENLLTRRYEVVAAAPGNEIVVANGSTTPEYTVTPTASDVDINPGPVTTLPFWNYSTDAVENPGEAGEQESYFTFLFANGTFSGSVINDEDDSGVENMSLQLVRCENWDAAELVAPPAVPGIGTCADQGGSAAAGSFQNILSAADGSYSFSNLREGIYQITIQTASASDSDGAFVPANTTGNGLGPSETFVFFIDGSTDLEQIEFRVDN